MNEFSIELVDNLMEIDAPFVVEMMESHLMPHPRRGADKSRGPDCDEVYREERSHSKSNRRRRRKESPKEFCDADDEVYQPSINNSFND